MLKIPRNVKKKKKTALQFNYITLLKRKEPIPICKEKYAAARKKAGGEKS